MCTCGSVSRLVGTWVRALQGPPGSTPRVKSGQPAWDVRGTYKPGGTRPYKNKNRGFERTTQNTFSFGFCVEPRTDRNPRTRQFIQFGTKARWAIQKLWSQPVRTTPLA